jgi:hypothetical protein
MVLMMLSKKNMQNENHQNGLRLLGGLKKRFAQENVMQKFFCEKTRK